MDTNQIFINTEDMENYIKIIQEEIVNFQDSWSLQFWNETGDFEQMNSDFATRATVMLETIHRNSKDLSDMLLEVGESAEKALTSFIEIDEIIEQVIEK